MLLRNNPIELYDRQIDKVSKTITLYFITSKDFLTEYYPNAIASALSIEFHQSVKEACKDAIVMISPVDIYHNIMEWHFTRLEINEIQKLIDFGKEDIDKNILCRFGTRLKGSRWNVLR